MSRSVHLVGVVLAIIMFTPLHNAPSQDAVKDANAARIKPYEKNPRYWQLDGEPVLLLGGSKDDNLFQYADVEEHLDLLAKSGGNVIRNTMSARLDHGHEVQAFKQLPNGKYDLDDWNEEYWRRFENCLKLCEERGIVVQIELWDRFDYTDNKSDTHWQVTPYNPKNNVNYTYEESGFKANYPDHPARDRQPFFHTVPDTPHYQPKYDLIRKYQERYVDKVLSCTLPRKNVLYCMNNETGSPPEWGQHWMRRIEQRAKEAGVDVYVTDMFDHTFRPWDCPSFLGAIDNPKKYEFLDVSQNNSRNFNEDHWKVLMWIRDRAKDQPPRPMNNTKVYGAGFFSFGTGAPADGVERFFRNITGGCASARFHREPAGIALTPMARGAIRAARTWTDLVPMWEVEPMNELLSDREEDEAYLAAQPGEYYALYFTEGGSVGLDLSKHKGEFTLTWIDIGTGKTVSTDAITGGKVVTLAAPEKKPFAAAIVRK